MRKNNNNNNNSVTIIIDVNNVNSNCQFKWCTTYY